MGIDGNQRQVVGFKELNGPELCNMTGQQWGKLHTRI
jgi:hypothetical protein